MALARSGERPLPRRHRLDQALDDLVLQRAAALEHAITQVTDDAHGVGEDELAQVLRDGTLQRNFQGYSTQLALELIGIGVSSISSTALR